MGKLEQNHRARRTLVLPIQINLCACKEGLPAGLNTQLTVLA